MLIYAQINMSVELVRVDNDRAANLLTDGSVEVEYLKNIDFKDFKPILLCLDVPPNDGRCIVDGNHRYVAAALSLTFQGKKNGTVPAYVFEKDLWMEFIIPEFELKFLKITDPSSKYRGA